MKKLILFAAVAMIALSANAQEQKNYTSSSKFFDNWSITLQGGVVTPMNDFCKNKSVTPVALLGADKYITPVFGVGLEARTSIGVGNSCYNPHTAFDAENISGYVKFNLANLFLGYKGHRYIFEPVAYTGLGWGHTNCSSYADAYKSSGQCGVAPMGYLIAENTVYGGHRAANARNYMTYRAGVEFNFNLGKQRAWAIVLNPSVVWGDLCNGRLDKRNCNVELTAGVVYHFKTSNGTHDFVKPVLRSQAEIDGLNKQINSLKADVDAKAKAINTLNDTINALKARGPKVVTNTVTNTVTKTETKENLECYVYFGQGKTVIAPSQLPNVERIATFLNHHKDSKVVVKGYASPEGSVAINQKIANARAEAVKSVLVNKYRIDSSRITAEGQGVGNSFSEPDWNRVSICTIMQ